MLTAARGIEVVARCGKERLVKLVKGKREVCKLQHTDSHGIARSASIPKRKGILMFDLLLSHQQAWSSGYDFCLTTQVFGYTEGSEFDSQGL